MVQTHKDSPTTIKPAKRPVELGVRMGWYILKNRLRGRKRFPLVTMLEPLEMCNLACIGCGRIREYRGVLDKMMPVEEAMDAVHKSGAPIVSIAGGEPTIHPQIDEIINTLVDEKYFVYCCTNALLLPRMLDKIPPLQVLLLGHPHGRDGGKARRVGGPRRRVQARHGGHPRGH